MDFTALFQSYLTRADMSQIALAKATDDHDSNINAVIKGKRPPPMHRLAIWAEALKLTDQERRQFIIAGLQANIPDNLSSIFSEIITELPATSTFLAEHSPGSLQAISAAEQIRRKLAAVEIERDEALRANAKLRAHLRDIATELAALAHTEDQSPATEPPRTWSRRKVRFQITKPQTAAEPHGETKHQTGDE